MFGVPPRTRKRLHDLARGPAKVINRSGGKGATALRAGLQKLPRNAAPRGADWDDEYEPQPSFLRDLGIAVLSTAAVTAIEQVVRRLIPSEAPQTEAPQIVLDSDEVATAIAASLAATDECEHCAECVCECHSEGDEE